MQISIILPRTFPWHVQDTHCSGTQTATGQCYTCKLVQVFGLPVLLYYVILCGWGNHSKCGEDHLLHGGISWEDFNLLSPDK